MSNEPRYFLGYGERLTGQVHPPQSGASSEPPYTLEEAVGRLTPRAMETASILEALPDAACPEGQAVAVMTLHPQSIAKSYFPHQVLNEYGLRRVGSRPTVVTPEKWTRTGEVEAAPSTDLFVAGARGSFRAFAESLASGWQDLPEGLRRIENVRTFSTGERVRGLSGLSGHAAGRREELSVPPADSALLSDSAEPTANLEVVLHSSDTADDAYVVEAFADYAAELGVDAKLGKRLYAGGLCFLPVVAPLASVERLSEFAFLRVARPVSRLRQVNTPIERSQPSPDLAEAPLPTEGPMDPDFRIAVFDGGLAEGSALSPWARSYETDGIGQPVPDYLGHGHDVTSAVLFGSLTPGSPAPQPYCEVDHFRVLDDESDLDPFDLYDVLRRIQQVLADRRYEFFNLSLGPAAPAEDDEVHPWTAVLDEYLSDGRAMATIAVGNCGQSSEPRIQTPSDCVNGLAVGSADSTRVGWKRAPYSAIGPGRSPGVVKPDLVHFGGSDTESFLVYSSDVAPALSRTCGTSFASPAVLRQATALRAHFGTRLSPLAIQALLIHSADQANLPRKEVGWGRTPTSISEIVLCPDGMVRVIYQGELTPSQYLRAQIPVPSQTMKGNVKIRATFCYATPVDPEDPGSYTRSGLEITFRPHADKFTKPDAVDPAPKPFFKKSNFDPEGELRSDAQKWETVLHREQTFRGTSLKRPVFDIHYNARAGGGPTKQADRIRYALVVDVVSPKTPDLYDQVSAEFNSILEAVAPRIDIPTRIQL